ncbi:MAG: hypothetical protein K2L88_05565 [Clostridiales bacterium]|nr:hypothetical protein [Clostridiales bacterium]
MKKKVKALIIAASVAAIAGIGAVSFAKWEAGSKTAVDTVGGSGLGTVTLSASFDDADATVAKIDGLLPYDQGDGKTYVVVTLPAITATEDFSVTVTYKTALALNDTYKGGATAVAGKLYAAKGDLSESMPTENLATTEGWKEIGSSCVLGDFTAGSAITDAKITIALDSDTVTDMGATFELTFTLGAKTAA